jgi:hypothetical protein
VFLSLTPHLDVSPFLSQLQSFFSYPLILQNNIRHFGADLQVFLFSGCGFVLNPLSSPPATPPAVTMKAKKRTGPGDPPFLSLFRPSTKYFFHLKTGNVWKKVFPKELVIGPSLNCLSMGVAESVMAVSRLYIWDSNQQRDLGKPSQRISKPSHWWEAAKCPIPCGEWKDSVCFEKRARMDSFAAVLPTLGY